MAGRRYRILKKVGEGRLAGVYLADALSGEGTSHHVALKVLHEGQSQAPEVLESLRHEARVLGRLRHPNVVQVEDLVILDGRCAIVMEHRPELDLQTLMQQTHRSGGRIPPRAAVQIVAGVARALEYAYSGMSSEGSDPLYLVHRDIKPSNVLVGFDGVVRVLDFGGITAVAFPEQPGPHHGTQGYVAPERIQGAMDSHRGDTYSMGVVLYEMLAGQRYGRVHLRPGVFEEMLQDRLEGLPLGDLEPSIAEQVCETLSSLLAYDVDARPRAAEVVVLMDALAPHLPGEDLVAFAEEQSVGAEPAVSPDEWVGRTLSEDPTPDGKRLWFVADPMETLDAALDDLVDSATIDAMAGSPFRGVGDDPSVAIPKRSESPAVASRPTQVGPLDSNQAPNLDPNEWSEGSPTEVAQAMPIEPTDDDAATVRGATFDPMAGGGFITSHTLDDTTEGELSAATGSTLDSSEWEAAPTVIRPPDAPSHEGDTGVDSTKPMPIPHGYDPLMHGGRAFGPAPTAVQGWMPPPTQRRFGNAQLTGPGIDEPTGDIPFIPQNPMQKAREAVHRVRNESARIDGAVQPRKAEPRIVVASDPPKTRRRPWVLVSVIVMVGLGLFWWQSQPSATPAPPVDQRERIVPGGVVEANGGADSGTLILEVRPQGVSSVDLFSSIHDYRLLWSTDAPIEVVGLPAGIYKSKVVPSDGSPAIRGTVEVLTGLSCNYRFDFARSGSGWEMGECL